MMDIYQILLGVLALTNALIYFTETINFEKAGVVAAIAGVVVNLILVYFIIRFNLRQLRITEGQLKATEKAADVSYKALLATKYSRVSVSLFNIINSRGDRAYDYLVAFRIQANIPTEVLDVTVILEEDEKKFLEDLFPKTLSEILITSATIDIMQEDIGKSVDVIADYIDAISEKRYRKKTHFLILPIHGEDVDDLRVPFQVKLISEFTSEIT